MKPFDVHSWVIQQKELIGMELSSLSSSGACGEVWIQRALEYTLLPAGKLLRGLLVTAVAEDIAMSQGGSSSENTISFSAAIECLHSASLIHDDLPALDNDDYRRGGPACHKKFGEGVAVLIGDLLVGLACESVAQSNFHSDFKVRLHNILAESWKKLCVGQILDVSDSTERDVEKIIEYKTGALFEAACAGAAVCAGVNNDQVNEWKKWGLELGVLFQKVDDYLDGDAGDTDSQQIMSKLLIIKDSFPMGIDKSNSAVIYLIETLIERSLNGVVANE